MIKIAICDDDYIVAESLKNSLLEHDFDIHIEIDTYQTGNDLYINSVKKKYDIILLDIELSKDDKTDNGLIISNKIKNVYPEVVIIFFSGYLQYEHVLLNFEPFRFIRKPVNYDELFKCIKAAIARIKGWEDKYIILKYKGCIYIKLEINQMLYITSRSPYIIVKCIDDNKIEIRGKIDDIQKDIEKITNDFCRPNKSFLVNKKYINRFSSKELILNNGETINISRKYSTHFFQSLEC